MSIEIGSLLSNCSELPGRKLLGEVSDGAAFDDSAFDGSAFDGSDTVRVRVWRGEALALPDDKGTHYGFVWQGAASLKRVGQDAPLPLQAGMYFSLAEAGTLCGESSAGMVVTHMTHRGAFLLGGPVAAAGRLAYIDGGTTSLLVPPLESGDPCLNALYMPGQVVQTVHSHPSDRVGIVVRGSGDCVAMADGDVSACYALRPGTVFHISAQQPHRFCTGAAGLDLIVFHPDSDMGMTHRDHPMLRRTLVEGVSAVELPEIQTRLSAQPDE